MQLPQIIEKLLRDTLSPKILVTIFRKEVTSAQVSFHSRGPALHNPRQKLDHYPSFPPNQCLKTSRFFQQKVENNRFSTL